MKRKGKNPFKLSLCSISDADLQSFRKRIGVLKLAREIEQGNKTIENSLQNFYKKLITKSEEFRELSNEDYCQDKIFSLIS